MDKAEVWCEDEERSIPLQVERKVKVNTQGKDQLLLLRVSRQLAIFRQLAFSWSVDLQLHAWIANWRETPSSNSWPLPRYFYIHI